ncbi:MAG: hypothetical protein AB9907_03170 [Flexilinea sp.]|jgi:tRNA nucleotidyltransferase/poly(A) polymerase
MNNSYSYTEIFEAMRKVVPPSVQIYLVGGAVRDILLNNKIKDYDFVVEGLVRPIGKKLAKELNGQYYILDDERDMVRVILNHDSTDCYCIDIARLTGSTLNEDLRLRDFTINAIAIDFMEKNSIIDPLMGVSDLKDKRLRMCSFDSLEKDPLRAMRSIRMALEYSLMMDDDLISALKAVIPSLPSCSMERYRDEFFKIMLIGKTPASVQLLEKFGFLDFLFSSQQKCDMQPLINLVRSIDHLENILTRQFIEDDSANLMSGLAVLNLGSFRNQLMKHFDNSVSLIHDHRSLILFTAIAKLYGFIDKEIHAEMMKQRSKQFMLSSDESKLVTVSFSAWETLKKTDPEKSLSDLEIHRFFHKYGSYGVDGFLLYLSDVLSCDNHKSDVSYWQKVLNQAALSFDSWFNRFDEVIKPEKLISGNQLSTALNIPLGPKIGLLKEAITEAQVEKKVSTYEEAITFARSLL